MFFLRPKKTIVRPGDKVPDTRTAQIASSTLWQVASQVTMAALSIVMLKMTALVLSQELFGHYNTAYGYLQIFGILADFGLYAVSVREISRANGKTERERVLGTLLLLRIFITALSLGSAVILAWVIPHWQGTPLPLGISIAALVPGFTLLAGTLRAVFQVEYRMHFVFVAEVAQRILTLSLTFFLFFAGIRQTDDARVLQALLFIGGCGAALLFLLSLIFAARFMRIRPSWDTALLRRMMRLAAPYGVAFLATALYRQFDVTLIGLLRTDYAIQNAYYGAVQRMMDMAYIFPTFLLNSALPILTKRIASAEDTRNFLGAILFAVLLLGSTAALFAVFWARPLVELLTTSDYLSTASHPGSDSALSLLSVSMFMNGLIVYSFYVLLANHQWKPLVLTLLLGATAAVCLNIFLIPVMGFMGATTTSALVHSALAIALLAQSYRSQPFALSRDHLQTLVLYAASIAAFLFVAKPFLVHSSLTAVGLMAGGLWIAAMAWGLRLQRFLKI